jgi:hypothetical protein
MNAGPDRSLARESKGERTPTQGSPQSNDCACVPHRSLARESKGGWTPIGRRPKSNDRACGMGHPGKATGFGILMALGFAGLLVLALLKLCGPASPDNHAENAAPGREAREDAPLLGNPDARHVLIEYFDYPCGACRTMSGYLGALMHKHPADVAVMLMPVPMDGACNVHADTHPGSCEMTAIALAVWRANPEAFPTFHSALLSEPSPTLARELALGLIDEKDLETAATDPWIDTRIRRNIAGWRALSESTGKLPKLVIKQTRILHGLPSGEADFIRVMEQELGLDADES